MTLPTLPHLFRGSIAVAALAFALWIATDTLRTIVPLWSPLPWYDEWGTVEMLRRWQDGEASAAQALFAQHNEHRILVPRLVFIADGLLAHGGGLLSLGCIFAVQALHAGVFAAVLSRARPRTAGRWAIAALILALMFGLRQGENLTSAFQVQFVGVFAGATLTFALFAWELARAEAGAGAALPVAACLGASLLTALAMANGLVAAWIVAALAAAARRPARAVLAWAAWAATITAVYLWGYEAIPGHADPMDSLAHPTAFLLYVAAYLGSVASDDSVPLAAGLGAFGLALAAWAAWRTFGLPMRPGRPRPAAVAMVGVMLFAVAAAAVTASGRLSFGTLQALSSRYATGSVAFWAAQLTYWWVDPPRGTCRLGPSVLPLARPVALSLPSLARGAVAAVAVGLGVAVMGAQAPARTSFVNQSFAQNESANLLMLGLDDPAVVERAAWSDEMIRGLLPTLEADGLSIFASRDHARLGRSLDEVGPLGAPCGGGLDAAVADPALGLGGVRASGRALDGRRILRRVLLADAAGRVVGFGSGAVPGGGRDAWRGFALAAPGEAITAYGLVDGVRLCRIGEAVVAALAGPAPDPAAAAAR